MNDFFLETLKKQGAFVGLLLLIAWILYAKLEKLENRIQLCEAEKFEIIIKNSQRSDDVINRNTLALDRNTEVVVAVLGLAPIVKKARLKPITAREGMTD